MPDTPRRETADVLRFPVPSAPLPDHPAPTVDMILAANEAMLPVWNADPQRETARLALKCRVRFVLGPGWVPAVFRSRSADGRRIGLLCSYWSASDQTVTTLRIDAPDGDQSASAT